MDKTVDVIFPESALPGVRAVGSLQRGQKMSASAAEAVRLVDAKGLAFASAADEKAARQGVAKPIAPEPIAAMAADTTEEY